ncbi:MAG: hypothetical protein WDW38_010926 [Sanguina aurantia]
MLDSARDDCHPCIALRQITPLRRGSLATRKRCTGLLPYQRPRTPSDLNHGYPHAFIRDPPTATSGVERIIQGALACRASLAHAGIVTFRNNLNKIAGTALNQSDPWVINAVFLAQAQLLPGSTAGPMEDDTAEASDTSVPGSRDARSSSNGGSSSGSGTLFLDIAKLEEKEYPNMDLYNYYGYKFESLCTGAAGVVDASSEFAALLGLLLGRHRVMLAAEMDCHMDRDAGGGGGASGEWAGAGSGGVLQPSYVELKTFVIPRHKAAEARLARNKYPKWWVQSYLAGVPTLVAGGRTTEGRLEEVRTIPVHQLPAMACAAGQPFDSLQVMRFCEAVLSWMTECGQAAEGMHLHFEYLPSAARITCQGDPQGNLPRRVKHALHPSP